MGSFGIAFWGRKVVLAEGEGQQRQSNLSDSLHESNRILGEHWEFYAWTAWRIPNRAGGATPAQKHSGWLWSQWVRHSWSISPKREKRNGSGARSQHKRQRSALCKSPKWHLAHEKAKQSHGASSHLPIFTSRWLLWNRGHDVPESGWGDETLLVEHANPFMPEPQLL